MYQIRCHHDFWQKTLDLPHLEDVGFTTSGRRLSYDVCVATSQLVKTAADVSTDIPFWDSHSPYFFNKND